MDDDDLLAAYEASRVDAAAEIDLPDLDAEAEAAIREAESSLQSSLDHIVLIQRKVDSLLAARDDAILQAAHRAWSFEAIGTLDIEEVMAWRERFTEATKPAGRRTGAPARSMWGGQERVFEMRRRERDLQRYGRNEPYGWSGTVEVIRWPDGPNGTRISEPHPPKGQAVVYVLFEGTEPVYVGSTGELASRLRQHGKEKAFDTWTAIACPSRSAAYAMEDRVLKERFPKLNKRRGA